MATALLTVPCLFQMVHRDMAKPRPKPSDATGTGSLKTNGVTRRVQDAAKRPGEHADSSGTFLTLTCSWETYTGRDLSWVHRNGWVCLMVSAI